MFMLLERSVAEKHVGARFEQLDITDFTHNE